MKSITGNGQYSVKDSGEVVQFNYEYPVYESLEEAIEVIGEDKALAMLNQTSKEDCANNSREKAKVDNGHSTRVALSPEQKEANKAKRAEDRALLKKIAQLSPAQREALGL